MVAVEDTNRQAQEKSRNEKVNARKQLWREEKKRRKINLGFFEARKEKNHRSQDHRDRKKKRQKSWTTPVKLSQTQQLVKYLYYLVCLGTLSTKTVTRVSNYKRALRKRY